MFPHGRHSSGEKVDKLLDEIGFYRLGRFLDAMSLHGEYI